MGMIAIDTETHPIAIGRMLPPIVCVSYAHSEGSGLLHVRDALPLIDAALNGTETIVGHNVAFDMGCIATMWPQFIPAIKRAYEDNRIRCTMLWTQLCDVALGLPTKRSYGLWECCDRYGIPHGAESEWRTNFNLLEPYPISMWPRDAIDYATGDAVEAYQLACALREVPDIAPQARWAFWLQLSSAFGIMTDGPKVDRWAADLEAKRHLLRAQLQEAKLIRENGTRDMSAVQNAVALAYHGKPPMTAGGTKANKKTGKVSPPKVQCSAQVCRDAANPLLNAYADYLQCDAALNRELPILRQPIVHTKYGMADTGRSTSKGDDDVESGNVQNMTHRSHSRQCFRPREGYVYAIADYGKLELCTLGQLCVVMGCGDKLASALREGRDPHVEFGCELLSIPLSAYNSHDPNHKQARRDAKDGNFGFPGGAGPNAYMNSIKRRYGRSITFQHATHLRNGWRRMWPDALAYQKVIDRWISGRCRACNESIPDERCTRCGAPAEKGTLDHYRSGRIRGGLIYTQACNTLFQGLGADVTKAAGWALTWAGYRIAVFEHDMFLVELPIADAVDGAHDVARIMGDVARDWLPYAPSTCSPTLSTRWVKDDPAYDSAGRLTIIDADRREAA